MDTLSTPAVPENRHREDDVTKTIHYVQEHGFGTNLAAKEYDLLLLILTDRLSRHPSKQDPKATPTKSLLLYGQE